MTAATLHLQVNDDCVYCYIEGKGWGYTGRVSEGETAHGVTYDEMLRLGNGSHSVDVDLKVPSKEIQRPAKGADQQLVDRLHFELFQERVGLANRSWLLPSIVLAFNPRTARRIIALLPQHHIEELREYAATIPKWWIIRRLRPKIFLIAHTAAKVRVPEENLVALQETFVGSDYA